MDRQIISPINVIQSINSLKQHINYDPHNFHFFYLIYTKKV